MLEALLSMLAMTLIVAVRYVAVSGGFAWLSERVRPGIYAGERMARQIRAEIGWSLSAAAIYGIPAGLAAYLWQAHGLTRIYTDPSQHGWLWLPGSVIAYLLAHDTWFYWTHRWMHAPRLFRLMHKVHHDSRPPTAWAAMSFHPWESLTGAIVIPALVFVVPIHVAALGLVLALMTFFGVTNHMGWELFPKRLINGPFGKLMITASHHQRHHQDYRCNYGLYFRHWDRLCGTDRGLGEFDDRKVAVRAAGPLPAAGDRA
jgi:Delta7-sterol 5-desaturase